MYFFQAGVQSVLQRIEDVQQMCDKRRNSLKRLVIKGNRPVQPVSPEPHIGPPLHKQPITIDYHRKRRKSLPNKTANNVGHERSSSGNRLHRMRTDGSGSDTSGSVDIDPDSANHADIIKDGDILAAKRGHVMRELIETERIYVGELQSIIEGYCDQMNNAYMQQLIPIALRGKDDILYGNIKEIYDFHAK